VARCNEPGDPANHFWVEKYHLGGARRDRSLIRSRSTRGECLFSVAYALVSAPTPHWLHARLLAWQRAVQKDRGAKMVSRPWNCDPTSKLGQHGLSRSIEQKSCRIRGHGSVGYELSSKQPTGVCPSMPASTGLF
jgi:hypothetical protein